MKNKIKTAFKLFWETLVNKEIDSKLFRKSIANYFYNEDSSGIISHFTDLKVTETKDKFIVHITTHRPGILIGKGGRTIDSLIEWLNGEGFIKPIEIDLKESKMWHNLY